MGSRTEFVALGIVVVLLFAAAALTLPHIQQGNFTPFAPKGWYAVGVVAVIIFWSFIRAIGRTMLSCVCTIDDPAGHAT